MYKVIRTAQIKWKLMPNCGHCDTSMVSDCVDIFSPWKAFASLKEEWDIEHVSGVLRV